MIFAAIAISLILQAPPIAPPRAEAPASISGVVVNGTTNEPIANVRVSLARTDASLGAFGQMIASDRPPGEATLPGELLTAMADRMILEAAAGGITPNQDAEVKAITSLPLADIQEMVMSPSGEVALVYKSAPPMMTDSQGRFGFPNVQPGTYKLIFASNGYARQDFGQRGAGSTGIPIVMTAGQVKNDIVMRMSPVSAISGRISDTSGQPIAGVPVQLFRFAYDETGERKVQRAASTQTNDRGDYRIYYLSAGRYYLNAGNPPGQNGTSGIDEVFAVVQPANFAANRIPEKYALTYYPGVADANSAASMDIPPGADLKGVDLFLKVQQTYRIRGTIVDTRTGQPPANPSIELNLQSPDPQSGSYVNLGPGNGPNYNMSDGSFEFRNVSTGDYIVVVNLPSPAPPRPADFATMTAEQQRAFVEAQNAASLGRPRASTAVHVTTADVDGLVFRTATAGSISGRFRSEGDTTTTAQALPYLRVQLKSTDGSAQSSGGIGQSAPTADDGTFRMNGLWPGEYRLVVIGLPAGFYVKEARLGDADVLNAHMRFSTAETGTLDIVISPGTSQVDGTAANSKGQPVAGARVVLIPERNRDRTELYRPATADPAGHFNISGIAPGDYKLAAWEAIEPYAFFDPELIKQADDNGTRVRVTESSKQTVNVIPIP